MANRSTWVTVDITLARRPSPPSRWRRPNPRLQRQRLQCRHRNGVRPRPYLGRHARAGAGPNRARGRVRQGRGGPVLVTHSEALLKEATNRLDKIKAPQQIPSWYPDVRTNRVAVLVRDGA